MTMKTKIQHAIRNLIILFLFAIKYSIGDAFAQNFIPNSSVDYYFNPQNLGFSTPQTAELTKYIQANVDYYNGLLDFEIPILKYKDASFEIPISIKYISDGFKPGRRPSIIGNNWVLNVGGVISRNVYGSPDDVRGYKESTKTGKYMLDGLLVAIREGKYKHYNKTDLYNLNIALIKEGNPYGSGDLEYDLAPDIFNFSFGGQKGYFFIGNDGKIKSSLGEGYKIDISGLSIQNYSSTAPPLNSTIKITAPNGYIYEFGGNISYLEYNIPNNPKEIKSSPVQIISWYLKSINNTNIQRNVQLKYKQYEQKNKYKIFLLNAFRKLTIPWYGTTGPAIPSSNLNAKCITIEDRIQTPIIDTIVIDDVQISFKIGYWEKSFYNDTAKDLLRLDEIKETCGNISKSITFDYLQNGNYFFLHKLKLNSQGISPEVYSFDYNLNMNLPDTQTIAIDHWGYWNGGYAVDEDAVIYLNNINDRKAVNTNISDVTMLNRIVFPTKGETQVTYEYNRYNYWISKDGINKIGWDLCNTGNSIPCGGLRIKKIADFDPFSGKTAIRNFDYSTSTSKGSGIIGILPQYKQPIEKLTYFTRQFINGKWQDYKVEEEIWSISSNTIGRTNNIPEYHIGYSDVIEEYDDDCKISYHFSSMIDMLDNGNVNAKIHEQPGISRSFNRLQLMDKFGLYNSNDLSGYRGKLLSKTIYSSSQESISYIYNFNEIFDNYEISLLSSSMGLVANRIYSTPCNIIKEFHTDINGIEVNKTYLYNKKKSTIRKADNTE